jgi:hypothetical protein
VDCFQAFPAGRREAAARATGRKMRRKAGNFKAKAGEAGAAGGFQGCWF